MTAISLDPGTDAPPAFLPDRRRLRLLRLRRTVVQTAVVLLVVGAVVLVILALQSSFAARGVDFSFGFLDQPAGFQISEGVVPVLDGGVALEPFSASMTNAQAFVLGVINTLKMAVLAIVLATALGAAIGVGRLSTNWLIRQVCFHIVEFMRNTPLLIQLTFWYTVVVLGLPSLKGAVALPGGVYISRQGTWLPWFHLDTAAPAWVVIAALAGGAGLLAALIVKRLRGKALVFGAAGLLVLALAGGLLTLDMPELGKFNAKGGLKISAEFIALLLAITLNSAAYIGEIVRGAIESLPKGQWEAAAALGFSRRHTLGDVVLPQVFRVVLPSFGNQYIGLAKNTSLGIAVGYPDLFNVFGTVANQTGRTLESIGIVMVIYLLISLGISWIINRFNRRLGRKEKRS